MSDKDNMECAREAGLQDAIALAVTAHLGVMDKSGQPYILHPLRVMFACETPTQKIVAILHDVIEDTDRTLEDLAQLGYSQEVLAALDCVTKRAGESYDQFVDRAAGNPIARQVKIADIEDNMDVRRLRGIGMEDFQRLTKYLAAWQKLNHINQTDDMAKSF